MEKKDYEVVLYERILRALLEADKFQMRRISDFAEDIVYGDT